MYLYIDVIHLWLKKTPFFSGGIIRGQYLNLLSEIFLGDYSGRKIYRNTVIELIYYYFIEI